MSDHINEVSIYEPTQRDSAIRQGELITDLIQLVLDTETFHVEEPAFQPISHPYALVVSQDCDLDWDYRARNGTPSANKLLPSILLCEVSIAEGLRGTAEITSNIWNNIRNNKNERYQFLQRVTTEEDAFSEGLPELSVDFKRYFTMPTAELYFRTRQGAEARRRCRLRSPYVEHFSSRFYYFQSRIALPSEHFSEPVG